MLTEPIMADEEGYIQGSAPPLAAEAARGGACMKLRVAEQRTAEQENIEGWNHCALSFESIKLDRIPSFDIRYSLFDIRFFILERNALKLKFLFGSNWSLRRLEAALNTEHCQISKIFGKI